MERIGEIIKRPQSLTSQPSTTDGRAMSVLLQQSTDFAELAKLMRDRGAKEWEIKILQVAQDRRHDLAPATIPLWREKLKQYRDEEVCAALLLWSGEFFPSVDDVIELINRRREVRHGEVQNAEWSAWKANNKQAEAEGRLATDDDYEQLRAKCREIMAKAPVIRASGRAHAKTGTEGLSVSAGDRAASEISPGGGSKPKDGTPVGNNAANEPGCMVATSQEDD